jgi:hypothetical protein
MVRVAYAIFSLFQLKASLATAISHVYDDVEELGAAINRPPQGRIRIRIL